MAIFIKSCKMAPESDVSRAVCDVFPVTGYQKKKFIVKTDNMQPAAIIVVVEKNVPLSKRFFLQPLIPQFHISEHIYGKRYK